MMTKPSKFVAEVLVDGALYHTLECGHVHAAVNIGADACPAETQDCERCGRSEVDKLPN